LGPKDSPPIGPPQRYRAPSWSWTSIDGPVWHGDLTITYPHIPYKYVAQTEVIVQCFGYSKEQGLIQKAHERLPSWVEATAHIRGVKIQDVVQRFRFSFEENPHYFSDHIILDVVGADAELAPLLLCQLYMGALIHALKTPPASFLEPAVHGGSLSVWFLELICNRGTGRLGSAGYTSRVVLSANWVTLGWGGLTWVRILIWRWGRFVGMARGTGTGGRGFRGGR
jgi:hypothetical protein